MIDHHPAHLNKQCARQDGTSPPVPKVDGIACQQPASTEHISPIDLPGPNKSLAFGLGMCILADTVILGVLEYWPALYVGIAVFFTAILLSPYSEVASIPALIYGLLSLAIYCRELSAQWPWRWSDYQGINVNLILDSAGISATIILLIAALWTMRSVRGYKVARQRAIRRRQQQLTTLRKPIVQVYPHQTPDTSKARARAPTVDNRPNDICAHPDIPPKTEASESTSPRAASKSPRPCYLVEQNPTTGETTIHAAKLTYTHDPLKATAALPPQGPTGQNAPAYAMPQPMYHQSPLTYQSQSPLYSPPGAMVPPYQPQSPHVAVQFMPQSPPMAPLSPPMAPLSPPMATMSPLMAPLSPAMATAPLSPQVAPQYMPQSPVMGPQQFAPQTPQQFAPQAPQQFAPQPPQQFAPQPPQQFVGPTGFMMGPQQVTQTPGNLPQIPARASANFSQLPPLYTQAPYSAPYVICGTGQQGTWNEQAPARPAGEPIDGTLSRAAQININVQSGPVAP